LRYLLSLEADLDLEEVFDYTLEVHGLDQAEAYVSGFDDVFSSLTTHPELGSSRDEIKVGLRSLSYESHIVFYRIQPDHIRIVRGTWIEGSSSIFQEIARPIQC
jgi:toxin ParE1/3/4